MYIFYLMHVKILFCFLQGTCPHTFYNFGGKWNTNHTMTGIFVEMTITNFRDKIEKQP